MQGPRAIGSSPGSQLSRVNTLPLNVTRSNSPSPLRVGRSTTPPPPLRSHSSNSLTKRPLYDASPRASPSKKLATLSTDQVPQSNLGVVGGRRSSSELRVNGASNLKGRSSNESRRSRRNNGSGASTIRGISPPLIEVPNSTGLVDVVDEEEVLMVESSIEVLVKEEVHAVADVSSSLLSVE